MIYFDLDGVIRDLHGAMNWKPTKWDEDVVGVNFYEYITSHLNVLADALPTEYYDIIKQHNPLVLSAQPKEWRPLTLQWITKYLLTTMSGIIFVDAPNDKFKYVHPSDLLIEDCPTLKSYSNVILIDRPWNQEVKVLRRVKTPLELDEVLRKYNKGRR